MDFLNPKQLISLPPSAAAMATTDYYGLPIANKQVRMAVRFDKWLDREQKTIGKMIAEYEDAEKIKQSLVDSLNEPGLFPEARLFTNKCINQISLALDELWTEIREAQARHMKNIMRVRSIVMAIKA